MQITDMERKLLTNIARNEYTPVNGAEPATNDDVYAVWSNCLDCGPHKIAATSIPGILSSLVKKGLADSDGEQVSLTDAGFAAYKLI